MTTYLGKSCSFCLPRVPFVNCRQFMYLVISLLVLRAGYGIWLYQFLIIAYLFTTLYAILCSLIGVYTICHSQSDQGLQYLPLLRSSIIKVYTICYSKSDQGLQYFSFSAVWSGSTLYAILCSLIGVYSICHSQSDQGLQYLPFSEVWSGSTLFAILSKQYYQGLHCLPFLAVWSGLHCLPFSAGLSDSTLFAILSLISVYTICHSQQCERGLHYLLFSVFWSESSLFAF